MPHTEVVVIRDGDVILRRVISPPTHPGKGIVMADAAATTTATRRSFAEALQLKEHSDRLRSAVTGTTGKAKNLLAGLWNRVTSSAAYSWAQGLLAGAWSFASRQASKLGRTGMIAAALSVVTSERGQRYLGQAVGLAGRLVDSAVRATIKVVSWIPFVGKPAAAQMTRARHWAWNKVLDLSLRAGNSPIVQAFHHEGFISRNVRRFAGPTAVYFTIARLVPGFWKIPAYGLFICWVGLRLMGSRPISLAAAVARDFSDGFKDGFNEQNEQAATEPTVRVVDPINRPASTVPEAQAPSTTDTPTGPVLAGNAAHVAAEVAEEIKAEQQQARIESNGREELAQSWAKRVVASDRVARLTDSFFAADKTYKTPGACKAALKVLVLPEFKTAMASKWANIAAGKFCDRMLEVHQAVLAGDQEFEDYAQDAGNPILLDRLQMDAMDSMQAAKALPRIENSTV